MRTSYLLLSHHAQLLKVGRLPGPHGGTATKEREEREVGEESREGGKLMGRLADGWRVGGKSHWWLLHPLSAY